jgi:hypothetical protein
LPVDISEIVVSRIVQRIVVGVCIAIIMMLVHKVSRAGQWAVVTATRSGGVQVLTINPGPGLSFPPRSIITPSDVGQGSISGRSVPVGITATRPANIPFNSAYGGGGAQNIAATVSRGVPKGQIIGTAAKVARLGSPLGWGLMVGSTIAPYIDFSNGSLKTNMQEESAGSSTPAAYGWRSQTTACGLSTTGYTFPAPTNACSYGANAGAQQYVGACGSGWNGVVTAIVDDGGGGKICRGNVISPSGSVAYSNIQLNLVDQASSGTQYCADGSVPNAGQCATPGTCAVGYHQSVNFFYGGLKCQPDNPASAPASRPVSEAEAVALMDYLTGNDPAKLAQLFTDVANSPLIDNVPSAWPLSDTTTVSGPSVGTPSTTTTPTPTGSTQTTITPNIVYNNNVVTITENVVNNYYDESGTLVGSNDTPPQESIAPANDSTLPAVVDFYTQKYPNGFGGVWIQKSAAMQSNAFTGLIATLTPSLASSGVCPSWTIGNLLGLTFGEIKPPCFIWDVIKVIFIVTALFMARRIIFGG